MGQLVVYILDGPYLHQFMEIVERCWMTKVHHNSSLWAVGGYLFGSFFCILDNRDGCSRLLLSGVFYAVILLIVVDVELGMLLAN